MNYNYIVELIKWLNMQIKWRFRHSR